MKRDITETKVTKNRECVIPLCPINGSVDEYTPLNASISGSMANRLHKINAMKYGILLNENIPQTEEYTAPMDNPAKKWSGDVINTSARVGFLLGICNIKNVYY